MDSTKQNAWASGNTLSRRTLLKSMAAGSGVWAAAALAGCTVAPIAPAAGDASAGLAKEPRPIGSQRHDKLKEAYMSEQYPRTALFGTEERTLFSTIRGREYHLSVALPDSYKTSTQAYPVIYVLDSDYNFGMAAGLTPFSNWFRKVPELIIVGIGYGMESSDEFVQLRELDFDIPGVPGAASDSAPNLFLDALTQEMIPFINANYRTIPSDRCLQGYSSGGIFVLYALFQQPDAFQRYISGSAILKYTYDYWIQHDAQLAARNASNPIQLYLSVGQLEEDDLPNFQRFVAFLEQGNYPGLTVSSEIYAGEGHGSEGIALTYLHGIAMVYPQVER